MGPTTWREFIYPQLKRMYAAVRAAGKQVMIHSCGDVDEVFDDLVAAGLNCFNPFQPEVMDVFALLPEVPRAAGVSWGAFDAEDASVRVGGRGAGGDGPGCWSWGPRAGIFSRRPTTSRATFRWRTCLRRSRSVQASAGLHGLAT